MLDRCPRGQSVPCGHRVVLHGTKKLMTGTAAVLQTPVGFLVDRYGARPFLIGGALLMSLAIALMAFATAFWQILALSSISGAGNAVFHPCDYAILAGSIRKERMGRSFALHGFSGSIGFALAPPTITALLSVMDWSCWWSAVLVCRWLRPSSLRVTSCTTSCARMRRRPACRCASCCSTGRWACSSCSIFSAPWRAAA